jgi:hypothetical protein
MQIREGKEIFDVTEFRLSYTCPSCGTEFTFKPDVGLPSWVNCQVCRNQLVTFKENTISPGVALWHALSLYREFHKFVTDHKFPLKLVAVVKPEPGSPAA